MVKLCDVEGPDPAQYVKPVSDDALAVINGAPQLGGVNEKVRVLEGLFVIVAYIVLSTG